MAPATSPSIARESAARQSAFFDLAGRNSLIVGGSRGIGRAIAERFHDAGANVCIVGRSASSTQEAVREVLSSGRKVVGVAADANDPTAVDAAHREAERLIGPIDILIITAGVVGPSAPVWAYDLNTFNEIIAVNFMGTVHWLRAALPSMRARRHGSIVTFASVAGKEGNPQQSAYCAAKAAVMALTKSVAKEVVADGIRVNCIAPGIVATDMSLGIPSDTRNYILSKVPMGRMGLPQEIAAVAHLLASDEAGFTTGQVYDASGGRATY
jgi:NAD(P)-dependent dehydrogenase (short-subunit alcohol dehydrogenase family)